MNLVSLAFKSSWNRRASVLLTVFTIAISVMLLLSIERVREEAKTSFANTISGTDLIVGARTGDIQLLLSSVFRIGHANNAVQWQSYNYIKQQRGVAWTIPISLGDSHKGFAVLGTDSNYFEHYRFGKKQPLSFQHGRAFVNGTEVVVGSEVARKLHYHLGQEVVISHGMGNTSFHHHDDNPLIISGILAPTGTPVDKTIHVPLIAIEAMHGNDHRVHEHKDEHQHAHAAEHKHDHKDEHQHAHAAEHEHDHKEEYQNAHTTEHEHDHKEEHQHAHAAEHEHDQKEEHQHAHAAEHEHDHKEEHQHAHAAEHEHEHKEEHPHDHAVKHVIPRSEPSDLVGQPKQITAFLMGFDSPLYTLQIRRNINEYKAEPLLAIMPGVTLRELWGMLAIIEKILLLFSIVVIIISLLGMLTTLLATLNQRRRELAILRSVGARPWHVFALLSGEAIVITAFGSLLGIILFFMTMMAIQPVLQSQFGLGVSFSMLNAYEVTLLGAIMLAGAVMGIIPALRAYYYSLSDGMSIKV